MRLLALIEQPDHVCFRYRVQAYESSFAEAGWTLESLPLSLDTFARYRQIRAIRDADVIVLQRKLMPLWQVALLRRKTKTLIYDFDDALFCRDSFHGKSQKSWSRAWRFWGVVYAADAVLGGNEFLCGWARRFTDADRVHYVPTTINAAAYRPATHERLAGAARLIWIGQKSTLPSIQCAQQHLNAAAESLPGLSLVVVADHFPEFQKINVIPRTWSSSTEAEDLASADIGISWLPDDEWSRGKCGLKVLQYLAAGLPVVANRVGANVDMIIPGETGFLADTPEEWRQAIEQLARDPALRRRMGQAARQFVRDRYWADTWGKRFVEIIESTAKRTGQRENSATAVTAASGRIDPANGKGGIPRQMHDAARSSPGNMRTHRA